MSEAQQPRVVGIEPLDSLDRKWLAKAEELELAALPNIRAAAEKWAATLTGVLGAVGVAALLDGAKEFDGIDDPEKTVGKLVFFAAVLAGLWATKHAVQAAQEVTPKVFLPGGAALRSTSQDAVETAIAHLKSSRFFAVVAVTLVLTSAAVVWWGRSPDAKPSVIEVQGSILCRNAPAPASLKTAAGTKYVVRCAKK